MKVTPVNTARMTNELHVQFHQSVHALIGMLTPAELGIEALYGLYANAFSNETEALLIITKSELTAKIAGQDAVRDGIFRGFSDTVKGFRNHFDSGFSDAANLLWSVFVHYGNIAAKGLDEQTAATNDLLRELDRYDLAEAVEKLQLEGWRDKMDEENQKLHGLVMQRYSESANQTVARMKTARVETDRYYRAIAAHTDNQMLIDAGNEAVNGFLKELNEIIRRYKSILARQLAKKSGKAGNDDDTQA